MVDIMAGSVKEEKKVYNLCIVGAGMIGSSAARHASLIPGITVCLVGPDEPQDRSKADIFGAYYDEGRIVRRTAIDPLWALLARRSMDRFRSLEQATGITFYEECGCLSVGPRDTSDFIENINRSANDLQSEVKVMDAREAKSRFPFIHFDPDHLTVYETSQAGYINPRKLVKAEQLAAVSQGCELIRDIAERICEYRQPDGSTVMHIKCASGHVIVCEKVLLATGAFTEFHDLLPVGVHPDIDQTTQTVIFGEVKERDLDMYRSMPCMLYRLSTKVKDDNMSFSNYILPPIKYPDGKYYMKLGHGPQFETSLHDKQEVIEWYRSQPPEGYKKGLSQTLNYIFPDFHSENIWYDTCLTSHTKDRRPFIDLVTSSLGVALAGNGQAAKSCDEFGRLAVELVFNNKWDSELPREWFKLRLKDMVYHPKL